MPEGAHATVRTDDGVSLHVIDEGSGPAVVLVGGYGMPSAGWLPVRRVLGAAGARVVTIDRRGHGHSACPPHGHTLDRHAADLECVLDRLDVDNAQLIGSSMGASVLWAYVASVGTGRVRSIVSVDQTPKMVNDDTWDLGLYGLTGDRVEAFVAGFPTTVPPGEAFRSPPPDEVTERMAEAPEFSFDATRELLRDHTLRDWRDVVRRVDVPVLAIAGRHSPLWPTGSSRWIAATAPHGAYAEQDTGHLPFLERPAEFVDLIDAFVGA